MLWSIDTCQNKVSADQCHVTISQAQVYSSSSSCGFSKLTADQALVSIESRAHVLLICSDQGQVVRKVVNANPGLRIKSINQSMNFSSIPMFFTAFESWAPGVV